MIPQELLKLISSGESVTVEFKRSRKNLSPPSITVIKCTRLCTLRQWSMNQTEGVSSISVFLFHRMFAVATVVSLTGITIPTSTLRITQMRYIDFMPEKMEATM